MVPKHLSRIEMRVDIERALSYLPLRQAQIIVMRFYENMTLKDIALEVGVTTERIRQLEAEALRRLRGTQHTNLMRFKKRVPSQIIKGLKAYL